MVCADPVKYRIAVSNLDSRKQSTYMFIPICIMPGGASFVQTDPVSDSLIERREYTADTLLIVNRR